MALAGPRGLAGRFPPSLSPPWHYSSTSAPPHLGLYHYLEMLHLCITGFQISGYSLCVLVSTSLFLGLLPFILNTPSPSYPFWLHSPLWPGSCLITVMFTLTPWSFGVLGLCQSYHIDPEAWLPHPFPLTLLRKVT